MTSDQAKALVDAPGVGLEAGPAEAAATARAAADRAACTVGVLHDPGEFADLSAVFGQIWRQPGGAILPSNLARAVAHAGGYVAGAFDASGAMVGGAFGFVGRDAGEVLLHSHITGALASGAGVGFALKLHQRAWCLAGGIDTVTWTFDPLVSRNAHFNLRKLGALATAYAADFYGDMPDAINAGDHTDRLVVRWDLASPRAAAAAAGRPAAVDASEAAVLLDADDAGRPRPGPDALPTAGLARCRVPMDVLELRRDDRDSALAWRLAAREALGGALDAGWVAVDATSDGWFVLASPGGVGR